MTPRESFQKTKKESIYRRKLLMSIDDYKKKYEPELNAHEYLGENGYFIRLTENDRNQPGVVEMGMLKFFENDWVPGGAWPGNYGMYDITDFTKYKSHKGRKRIEIEGGYDFIDSTDMFDLIPYPLLSTQENILAEVERKRLSIYNVPHRFHERYKDKLIIMINDTKCSESKLTEDMIREVLSEMTPAEKSKYQQSLYKINVSLYPSIEMPICIRIDGIDDGAEEALFDTFDNAKKSLEDIALHNNSNRRYSHGFRGTD